MGGMGGGMAQRTAATTGTSAVNANRADNYNGNGTAYGGAA